MRKYKMTDRAAFAAAVRANRATFIRAKRARAEFLSAEDEGAFANEALDVDAAIERLHDLRAAIVDGCNAYYDVCGVTWRAMYTIRDIDGVIEDLEIEAGM